ncbi:MAG TPA: PTS sugar transporter subunit IIA [Ktedonosporobacter sp.]|nr:PTS sugar transporter subunit IIA [Ktedonosporobacter sp.]
MIGIVLVSHGPLADGFKGAAEMIVGPQERFVALGMDPSADLDVLRSEIEAAVASVGTDGGALVLADLMGGSPANSSAAVALSGTPVICGVNLPMLLEVLMSRESASLHDLAETAFRAGSEGVVDLGKALAG